MTTEAISKMLTQINAEVTGYAPPQVHIDASDAKNGTTPPGNGYRSGFSSDPSLPCTQAIGLGVQSVAQSMAIAVQDATDLLRNISTIEATALGVATAKWVAEPENLAYKVIIDNCGKVIKDTAQTLEEIGTNTSNVLKKYAQIANIGDGATDSAKD